MMNTEELIDHLNASYVAGIPEAVQNEAIHLLAQNITDADLEKLVQPMSKSHWENAARVLEMIGFPRIWVVERGLVRWLQDLNWPGARTIYALLLRVEDAEFVPMIQRALQAADKEGDSEWVYMLGILINEKGAKGKLSLESQAILDKAASEE